MRKLIRTGHITTGEEWWVYWFVDTHSLQLFYSGSNEHRVLLDQNPAVFAARPTATIKRVKLDFNIVAVMIGN